MAELDFLYDERQLALSTLAASTALVSITKIDTSRDNGWRTIKVEGWAQLQDKTDGEGPVMFGMAANSMTASGIKSAIDADPQDSEALANQEAKYPVWPLGMFHSDEVLNRIIHFNKKINWSVQEGKSIQFWVYNMDSGALTTGALLDVFAKFTGVWLRD